MNPKRHPALTHVCLCQQFLATVVAFFVKKFILVDACDNVKSRVDHALLHAKFSATTTRRELANDPLGGYTFQPPNTCATGNSGNTDSFRNISTTVYNDFYKNFEVIHDAVQSFQKAIISIERALSQTDLEVRGMCIYYKALKIVVPALYSMHDRWAEVLIPAGSWIVALMVRITGAHSYAHTYGARSAEDNCASRAVVVLQSFIKQVKAVLEWLKNIDNIIGSLANIFRPIILIVNLIMGWLKCTKDEDGNVECKLFDQLDFFLKFLDDFPSLDVDWFLEAIFGPLLPFSFNFEIKWLLDWVALFPELKRRVSCGNIDENGVYLHGLVQP